MTYSMACERAAHIMEMAAIDQERMEAMGTANAPTKRELELDEYKAWARERDREIWLTITWPDKVREAAKYAARRMY